MPRGPIQDLSGDWTLEAAGRSVSAPVPGHWQTVPGLEAHTGSVIYRRPVKMTPRREGERRFAVVRGAFYFLKASFDGNPLGKAEGYFTPHAFELPEGIDEGELRLELDCPVETDKNAKRMITGVFSHWDCLDPDKNPGGLWLPVEIHRTGIVRIVSSTLLTHSIDVEKGEAEIELVYELDSLLMGAATLSLDIKPDGFTGDPIKHSHTVALASGRNIGTTGRIRVKNIHPWWTRELGEPRCYRARVSLDYEGTQSDLTEFTTGFRTFRFDNYIAYLNGKRFFVRGSNYPPGDVRISRMNRARAEKDIALALGCNFNMLRVHAHVDHPELYEAADRAGLLLWQDMPLQWLYVKEAGPEIVRQSEEMCRLLGSHPSVAVWCMHNEPIYIVDTKETRWRELARTVFSLLVFSRNREITGSSSKRAVRELDPTRPVIRSSGEMNLLSDGEDVHLYFGWYPFFGRNLRRLERMLDFAPRNARFITEFGAQSLPPPEHARTFMGDDLAKTDWKKLERNHHLQNEFLRGWVPKEAYDSVEALYEASCDWQAYVHRYYIDRYRKRKYHPAGGILQFMFLDSEPCIQWSVVDDRRVPKKSYQPLADAFRPVYFFALAEERYKAGGGETIPLYWVNDTQVPVKGKLKAVLAGPGGKAEDQFDRELGLPADSETEWLLDIPVPVQKGRYTLALTLEDGSGQLDHAYSFEVR